MRDGLAAQQEVWELLLVPSAAAVQWGSGANDGWLLAWCSSVKALLVVPLFGW